MTFPGIPEPTSHSAQNTADDTAPEMPVHDDTPQIITDDTPLVDWMTDLWAMMKEPQKQAINFMLERPFFGVFMDMGNGKTLATLIALLLAQPQGHILIVAPSKIAGDGNDEGTWEEEIINRNLPFRTVSLAQRDQKRKPKNGKRKKIKLPKAEREEILDGVMAGDYPPSIFVLCVDLFDDVVEYIATKGHRNKTSNYSLWPFQTLIIDESQTFSNPDGLAFKAGMKVRPYITRLHELSGTPAAENTDKLFAQMNLLDQGAALGTSYEAFHLAYFTPVNGPGNVTYKWEINNANMQAIFHRVHHLALYSATDKTEIIPGDDPIDNPVDHIVRLSEQQYADYEAFSEDSVLSILTEVPPPATRPGQTPPSWTEYTNDPGVDADTRAARAKQARDIIATNQGVLFGKQLQFASGALYLDDLDKEDPYYPTATAITKRPTVALHNRKIAELLRILKEHEETDGSPVLVAYWFTSERDRLIYHLRHNGYPGAEYYGENPETKSRWNAGEIPVLLAQPASTGHGLNLQYGGHTLIWFTLPSSSGMYMQTCNRLYRPGQTHAVTNHRILVADTRDGDMPSVLAAKRRKEVKLLNSLNRNRDRLTDQALSHNRTPQTRQTQNAPGIIRRGGHD